MASRFSLAYSPTEDTYSIFCIDGTELPLFNSCHARDVIGYLFHNIRCSTSDLAHIAYQVYGPKFNPRPWAAKLK